MTTPPQIRLLARILSVAAVTSSCAHHRPAGGAPTCNLFTPPVAFTPPALADLSAVKPFRSYLAVTHVEPPGHHFTVWYRDVEPAMERLRVARDAAGRLTIEGEAGGWGGVGVGPATVAPPPPEAAALARDLETALRARCPAARDWRLQYTGLTRTVTVAELIVEDAQGHGRRRFGWLSEARVQMNAALTELVAGGDATSGFGVIEIPANAQWLPAPAPNPTRLRFVGYRPGPPLFEAARRYAARARSLPLASLVPASAPTVPPALMSRVVAKVSVVGRGPRTAGAGGETLRFPLDLRDAVFGAGATVDATITQGQVKYSAHATLVPNAPRKATRGYASAPYAGTFTIRVEDDRGHAWQHAYPATGKLDLEDGAVVAPTGLLLPGASAPSPENDVLHGRLPGDDPSERTDVTVAVELADDPRL